MGPADNILLNHVYVQLEKIYIFLYNIYIDIFHGHAIYIILELITYTSIYIYSTGSWYLRQVPYSWRHADFGSVDKFLKVEISAGRFRPVIST